MSDFATRIATFSRARLELLCAELKERLDKLGRSQLEPLAVVGMACRFPGGVTDLDSYWGLLHDGVDAITDVPPERWDVDAFYDPNPDAPGKTYSRWGGFLNEVDTFDPLFFNISPREAVGLDPQHRLLLEVSWEALEIAGQNPQGLRGSRTGVFVGFGADDYAKILVRRAGAESITAYTGTGNAYCYGAGRISYFLGLQGPNVAVDTACSSSLVVTHLACQSLRAGECDLALAGGVHLMLSPIGAIFLAKARALSPDGRCKTFDASADGFVRGEGCGMVVLKRLSDAIAHRDRIYALVRGTAVNHDGPSSGFTVPNGLAQQAVIRAALKDGRLDASDVEYVETHGTGTSLGDPIEVRGLAATLGKKAGRSADHPLVIGSVKANIGHLEAAAGVAGLIKTVLALQHDEIPPQVHFNRVNVGIGLDEGPFTIPTRPLPWPPSDRPRIAGVSSFGLSGTNAHVIVQEAPRAPHAVTDGERPLHVFTLSARSERALRTLASRFERHVAGAPAQSLGDLCFTVNSGRAQFAHRLALPAASTGRLREELRAFSQGERASTSVLATGKVEAGRRPRVAFLFSGEGSEWAGMGAELYAAEPRFREAIDRCDELVRADLERPISHMVSAAGEPAHDWPSLAGRHAALFALEDGLLQLWQSWGVEPDAVAGHGLGEYVAAVAAGVMTFDDALRLVVERARLVATVSLPCQKAALTAEDRDPRAALDALGDTVMVSAINSPRHVAVVGVESTLRTLREQLKAEGIRVRLGLTGDGLYSTAAQPIVDPLGAMAVRARCQAARIPMVSTATGEWADAQVAAASHWQRHSVQPIRFSQAIETLYRAGYDHFLEIGPRPLLTVWGGQVVPEEKVTWRASLRPGAEWSELLATLSVLWVHGIPVDWAGVDRPYGRQRVPLPTYPFERQRFWLELSRPVRTAVLMAEDEAMRDAATRSIVKTLVRAWGDDGAQAINRRITAPLVFLSSTEQSLFYLNEKGSSMVIQAFVGAPEAFESAARELFEYARSRGQQPIVIASEEYATRLRHLGLATTPIGVSQTLSDLQDFSIHASGMRRLRSKIHSYTNRGSCSTEEYRVGSDPLIDRRIVELMHEWVTRKRKKAPFASQLAEWILAGTLPDGDRVFVTRRDGEIDSILILAPIAKKNGYLLDLEFYPVGMPPGSLEFGIVSIIEQLKREGVAYFSLGSTFSTRLEIDPHEDPRVRSVLRSFDLQGLLNDGNFEFKKKFGPSTSRLFVCSQPDADISLLPDTLLLLAVPQTLSRGREAAPASSPSRERDRVGADAVGDRVPRNGGRRASPPVHPLLGHRVPLALSDVVYESRLETSDGELSWLADHRVLDYIVFPAAGSIAMALAASRSQRAGHAHTLEALSFLEPLVLPDQGGRAAQFVYQPRSEGGGAFRISSARDEQETGESEWTLHATGIMDGAAEHQGAVGAAAVALAAVRGKGLAAVTARSHYEQVAHFGLDYRSRFRAVAELWSGPGEALARISAPGQVAIDSHEYPAHPVMLDACLQVQGAALLASRSGEVAAAMYLPAAIERIRIHAALGSELWAYCRLRPIVNGELQQVVGDIQIWNPAGDRVAEIEGVAVRRTSPDLLRHIVTRRQGSLFYQLEWLPQARRQQRAAAEVEQPRRWLVFADAAGTAARLASLAHQRGVTCVMAHPGESFEVSDIVWRLNPSDPEHFTRVVQQPTPIDRVVYLWSAEYADPGEPDLLSLRRSERWGSQGLLHLVRALAAAGANARELWVVTRGVQPVGGGAPAVNPAQAPVWGLGRTIAQEHPEFWGGLIDLDSELSARDADHLLDEISDRSEEDHVAFRSAERYVARLVGKGGAKAATPLRLHPDATYLVTGGAGGLGSTVARWMIARGARHLILVGRSPLSSQVQELLASLEEAGALKAVYVDADISREEEVARVLAQCARDLPPLRGVVHAAGALADGVLVQQSWSRFLEVMAPKVEGTWHLHNLTRDLALDHFILFSSSASILGAAGQGNYAAANAFMDSVAHLRHAQGLPALSINWGPWDDVGMSAALDARAKAQRAAQGIRSLAPDEAIRLLEQAVASGCSQIGIIAVDWQQLFKHASPVLRHSSIFKDLVAAADAGEDRQDAASGIVRAFLGAAPGERQALLHTFVAERVGHVLGLDPANLDVHAALPSLGFDSLMALELRERLEAELQLTIPIMTFFRSETVAEFAGFVLEELLKKHVTAARARDAEESPRALLARLDELSDADVEAALRRELAR